MFMVYQSALGEREAFRPPAFNHIAFAKVTSIEQYAAQHQVEVQLHNGSVFGGVPVPAVVSEAGLGVTPAEGDYVLLAYALGKKNIPIVLAFIKDKYAADSLLQLSKDKFSIYTYIGGNDEPTELLRASGGIITVFYSGAPLVTIADGKVTIDGTLALGAITDLEQKLNDLEQRIAALEAL